MLWHLFSFVLYQYGNVEWGYAPQYAAKSHLTRWLLLSAPLLVNNLHAQASTRNTLGYIRTPLLLCLASCQRCATNDKESLTSHLPISGEPCQANLTVVFPRILSSDNSCKNVPDSLPLSASPQTLQPPYQAISFLTICGHHLWSIFLVKICGHYLWSIFDTF